MNATADPVGIVELVDVCASMAARNRSWFERLGAWVTDEPDPTSQRWFAVAAHRHAWHAELWDGRRPTIAVHAPPPEQPNGQPTHDDPDDRAGWYSAELATMRTELTGLVGRVDPVLDPSTRRVIDLVLADLADLADLGVAQTASGDG